MKEKVEKLSVHGAGIGLLKIAESDFGLLGAHYCNRPNEDPKDVK